MNIDKKILLFCSYSALILLGAALLLPIDQAAWLCALLLSVLGAVFLIFVKKRAIYSYVKRQILYIMMGMGAVYATLYFLSSFVFGFVNTRHVLSVGSFFTSVLPIVISVAASELIRAVMLAQKERQTAVIAYFICILSEVLTLSTIPRIQTLYGLMDVVAMTFLPAVISNLLYHYLSLRYGAYPNIAYRLITGLFLYFLPFASGIPDSLYSMFKLLAPIPIYFFIDELYERKRRFALGKKRILSWLVSGILLVISLLIIMLISCKFRFGLLVVGSPSMTGEINTGDAVIYEQYTDQIVDEGDIIVFEKDGTTVIHRVVGIEIINNQRRYTTKGDANEDNDSGYITDSNITGVVEMKIPLVGYPTVWLRSLFNK